MEFVVHLKRRIRDPATRTLAQRFEERIAHLRGYKRVEGETLPTRKRGEVWILLDPHGEAVSTNDFVQKLKQWERQGIKRVRIFVGDADGWEVPAEQRWQFSLWVVSFELAFLIVVEQIYRVLTIVTHHPYHRGHMVL